MLTQVIRFVCFLHGRNIIGLLNVQGRELKCTL